MSFFGDNCECCQGLEIFLDPRQYTPQAEPADILCLPVWEQQYIKAELERAQKEAEEAENADVSVTTQNVLKLIVQGTNLINKNYIQIMAFQHNSFYVKLESLDTTWIDADSISLIFTHSKLDKSVIAPITAIGTAILVPNSVLIPGKLSIAAAIMNNDSTMSATMTNSIDYSVYAPVLKPIDYNLGSDSQLYFIFLNAVKRLTEDFERISAKIATAPDVEAMQADISNLKTRVKALEDAVFPV